MPRSLFRLADLLEANAGEAVAINALDNGTPVSALDSGAYTAAWTRYYAGWVDKLEGDVVPTYGGPGLDVVLPEPYGVIGAIVPWNGPMMGMGQKAVPALAAGNAVVAKPPELAPFGALRFAELALEAGVPPGCSTCCRVAPRPVTRSSVIPAWTSSASPVGGAPHEPSWRLPRRR